PAGAEDTIDRRLAGLDAALAVLGLRRAGTQGGRSLAQRVAGARRLLVRQVVVAVTQLVIVLLLALYAAR
ncbi:MAG TPA: hypothetical protein VIS78_08170, partial [Blastocatellia bacterium]